VAGGVWIIIIIIICGVLFYVLILCQSVKRENSFSFREICLFWVVLCFLFALFVGFFGVRKKARSWVGGKECWGCEFKRREKVLLH
jgi:Na+/proline symporter